MFIIFDFNSTALKINPVLCTALSRAGGGRAVRAHRVCAAQHPKQRRGECGNKCAPVQRLARQGLLAPAPRQHRVLREGG